MDKAEPMPDTTLAVAWDQTSKVAYSLVARLVRDAVSEMSVVAPGLEGRSGNLFDDQVVPAFVAAHHVVVWACENDPLWIAFQAGVATGLEKPLTVVAPTKRDAASFRGAPPGVRVLVGTALIVDAVHASTEPPPPVPFEPDMAVLLCPRETDEDRALLDQLKPAVLPRAYRRVGPHGPNEAAAGDVVWVVTPHGTDPLGKEWNLRPNVGNAFEAGRCYGAMLRTGSPPRLSILRVGTVPPVAALEHLTQPVPDLESAVFAVTSPGGENGLRLSKVVLRDLKCFESIEVPLSTSSPLGGAWTCIAGVNGAGKSTVLQAIALCTLGRRRAPELGLARLARMVRRDQVQTSSLPSAEIRLTVEIGSLVREAVLPLNLDGIDERRLSSMTDQSVIEQLWEQLGSQLIVAYGATRNISDTPSASLSLSPQAHRQLTLFDPLAQILSAEALTTGGARYREVLGTLARLVTLVLDEPDARFLCEVSEQHQLVFEREGARLGVLDLADGFRSVLALLADIASGWHELHPDAVDVQPADICGIVLVDEIDLHLHARLQRLIVPRLRAALPSLQWIVSTHSPFIAASFDQSEIVLLDRREKGGIRKLDRQIMAFNANELYDWLLETEPVSETGKAQMEADGGTSLLYQSPLRNKKKAQALLENQDELLAKLRAVEA